MSNATGPKAFYLDLVNRITQSEELSHLHKTGCAPAQYYYIPKENTKDVSAFKAVGKARVLGPCSNTALENNVSIDYVVNGLDNKEDGCLPDLKLFCLDYLAQETTIEIPSLFSQNPLKGLEAKFNATLTKAGFSNILANGLALGAAVLVVGIFGLGLSQHTTSEKGGAILASAANPSS